MSAATEEKSIASNDADELAKLDQLVNERRAKEAERLAATQPRPISGELSSMMERFVNGSPEKDAEIAKEEKEERERRIRESQDGDWRSVLHSAGSDFGSCRFNNYRLNDVPEEYRKAQSGAHAAVLDYAKNLQARAKDRCGLVLFGTVGTGKDHLAMAVVHAAIGFQMRVRWINGQQWFGSIRDAMDGEGNYESTILGAVTWPDVLVVSDPLPNVGELTTHQSNWLYRLANSRASNGKITITTVNVQNDDDADRRIGEATWDRLCHRSLKVFCRWPSHRKALKTVNC